MKLLLVTTSKHKRQELAEMLRAISHLELLTLVWQVQLKYV